jgi:exosortase/archaeosortase family protein
VTERVEGSPIGLQGTEWLLLAALIVAFTPALIELSEVWSRYEYYSHGYLVPFAALWAATAQRKIWPRLSIERSLLGGAVLGLGLVLYLMGRLASIVSLQGLALVVCVAGAVYFARGRAWLRSLSFSTVIPLAMLGNLIRVVGTIYVAQRFGSEIASGDAFHEWAGILTYVLGCFALLAVGGLMTRVLPTLVKD